MGRILKNLDLSSFKNSFDLFQRRPRFIPRNQQTITISQRPNYFKTTMISKLEDIALSHRSNYPFLRASDGQGIILVNDQCSLKNAMLGWRRMITLTTQANPSKRKT